MASRTAHRAGRRLPASPLVFFGLLSGVPALALAGLLFLMVGEGQARALYVCWAAAASLSTFVWYGLDKFQAQRGGFRVPELVLHGLALSGGWPGGWAGRLVFHHKTLKPVFTAVLLAAAALHASLFYFFFLR